jgi:hypothetical protein
MVDGQWFRACVFIVSVLDMMISGLGVHACTLA